MCFNSSSAGIDVSGTSQQEESDCRASKRRNSEDKQGVLEARRVSENASKEHLISCHSDPLGTALQFPTLKPHCSSDITDFPDLDSTDTMSSALASAALQQQQWHIKRRSLVSKSWASNGLVGCGPAAFESQVDSQSNIDLTRCLGSDQGAGAVLVLANEKQQAGANSMADACAISLKPLHRLSDLTSVRQSSLTIESSQFASSGGGTIANEIYKISGQCWKGGGPVCCPNNVTPTATLTPSSLFDMLVDDQSSAEGVDGFRISTVLTCGSSACVSEGGSSSDKQAKRDRHRRAAAAAIEQPSGAFRPATLFPTPDAGAIPLDFESDDDELSPELSGRGNFISGDRRGCAHSCISEGMMQGEQGSSPYQPPAGQTRLSFDMAPILSFEDVDFETPPPTPNSGEL